MKEAEWLGCVKLTPMMTWLRRRGSERQFYLAGCAAVRHVWHLISEQRYRDLIPIVEHFADDRTDREKLSRAYRAAEDEVFRALMALHAQGIDLNNAGKRMAASKAATCAAMPAGYEGAFSAMMDVARTGKRAPLFRWQCDMLRCIFGNPFRPVSFDPAWRTQTVVELATVIYEERELPSGHLDNMRLTVLSDALEDAGCDNRDILDHCRSAGPHVRGCWIVDRLLGKE